MKATIRVLVSESVELDGGQSMGHGFAAVLEAG